MAGILYGVGVGPGDPELMTMKSVRTIQDCEVIGIPARDRDSCKAYQIALQMTPEIAAKPVVAVPIPMTTDGERLAAAYEEGCVKIAEQLKACRSLAFLNLGDPTIYGTYMELHKRVLANGYEAKIISGVPSFCAVAAAVGVPLGYGRENIHILPGFYRPKEAEEYDGTRILMKSAGKIGEVKQNLIELEDAGRMKAYAVTNCGMESERIYQDIRTLDEEAGYFTTIIVKEVE